MFADSQTVTWTPDDDLTWQARFGQWRRQWWCGLWGHHRLTRFEHARVCLECVDCGHQTPGWELTCPPPIPRNRS